MQYGSAFSVIKTMQVAAPARILLRRYPQQYHSELETGDSRIRCEYGYLESMRI